MSKLCRIDAFSIIERPSSLTVGPFWTAVLLDVPFISSYIKLLVDIQIRFICAAFRRMHRYPNKSNDINKPKILN